MRAGSGQRVRLLQPEREDRLRREAINQQLNRIYLAIDGIKHALPNDRLSECNLELLADALEKIAEEVK